jgi:iron(II)-dependent oxidoreductase
MSWQTGTFEPDGALMVLVPAGPFTMGLPNRDFLAEDHEKPQRRVQLSAYCLDVYPVTNRRYRLFMEAGGYEQEQYWTPEGWQWKTELCITEPAQWSQAGWDGPEQPVAGVSWFEAAAFARWAGRRLPTDAEWEKAARGADGRRYPWGDDWPTHHHANFDSAASRTTPVGLFPDGVSPYSCHDMSGNVNNWTADWYWPRFGFYCVEHGITTDPRLDDELRRTIDPAAITEKVDRGGGFATPREYQEVLGCTRKVYWPPQTRHPWNGFRTAKDA